MKADNHRKAGQGRIHLQGKASNGGGTKWLATAHRPRKVKRPE